MVSSIFILALATAAAVQGAPLLNKRIAQVIAESTAKWEQACLAAGGGQQCNPLSVTAFTTLLAAAGPCEQQDAADKMIDLAKTLKSDPTMIKFTQIFVQQPRNSPNSVSIPYCQTAPKNSELNGLFQCQFQGSNPTTFVNGVKVGAAGTVPFGLSSPLSPPGSCPANPSGPIADGTQLVNLTQDPGVGSSTGGDNSSSNDATPAAPAPTPATPDTSGSAGGSGDFRTLNGQDAQALNAKFASLTADSSCTAGENACINGGFAQCVSGKFVVTGCGGGLKCFALPLVNSRGTSITCDTEADALARIAASGAAGGLAGSSPADTGSAATTTPVAEADDATSTSSLAASGGFKAQNGKDAQALNAKFATLKADSACTSGENACIGGSFAQCANGKFVVTQCAGGLKCFALPLVNSRGTSVTCDTEADAIARIAASGATGGLTGSSGADNGSAATTSPVAKANGAAATSTPAASGGFKAQNGRDAQALNAKFATLNAGSACTSGENACINGSFAQCANGKFVVTQCAGGLKCFALPLVNSRGTSVTCDTEADALARIKNSGATGGLTG